MIPANGVMVDVMYTPSPRTNLDKILSRNRRYMSRTSSFYKLPDSRSELNPSQYSLVILQVYTKLDTVVSSSVFPC
jgi:hypothetical protein